MALDFPASPVNGQVYGNFIYSSAKGAWQAKPITGKVTTSATAPSAPSNGDEWFNTNDGNIYVYYTDVDGSQWVQVKSDATLSSTLGNRVELLEAKPSGLIPVTPTSVDKTGGTATANALGQVTFTGVSSLSLNGVFTSEYRNYKIIFDEISAGDTSVSFRLRKAGTDATSGQYVANISYVTQTGTAQAFQSYASSSGFGVTSTTRHISAVMEIIKPQVTGYTKIFASSNHVSSAFDFRSTSTLGLFHAVSDSYDGITFYPDTSNFTGTISVYGYND